MAETLPPNKAFYRKPKGHWLRGEPQVTTEEHLKTPWRGDPKRFRCDLCDHKFQLGDHWRFVYAGSRGCQNLLVCKDCDVLDAAERGVPDVIDRFLLIQNPKIVRDVVYAAIEKGLIGIDQGQKT